MEVNIENIEAIINKFSKENVGVLIHALREDVDMSQGDVAKALKISQSTVSKIERGDLELSLSLYQEYLSIFKLSPNDFNKLIERYIRVTSRAQKANLEQECLKTFIHRELLHEIRSIRIASNN